MELFTENPAANPDAVIDAAPEGIATPEETAPTETDTAEVTPENIPAEPQETETQAFARRLKEKTSETEKAMYDKVNSTIAKLGGVTPEGNPIQTFEDLQRTLDYQEMQAEAQRQDVPVEVLSRLTQAEKDALKLRICFHSISARKLFLRRPETLSAILYGEFYSSHARYPAIARLEAELTLQPQN